MNKIYKQRIINFFKNIDITKVTDNELQEIKSKFARKYNLSKLPLTSDILIALDIKHPTKTFITKPSRTLSGVTVIAVMTKPNPCPGKCIYCPTYINTPKSYTGFEPASMRGGLNQYDPYKQVKDRLKQLNAIGHPTTKLEVIVMGGTFPSTSKEYQNEFVTGIYQAVTNSKSKNLNYLIKKAMHSEKRIIGLTFETRPDYCDRNIIRNLLDYGCTRIELGVQTTDNKVQIYTKRGHGTKEVIETTRNLKDSGIKVLYHMMVGLPGSNYKKDLKSFKEIFNNPDYCPDMIKIYPTLVMKSSELEGMYYSGEYKVYDDQKIIELIADIKEIVPKWVRIMRVQRDIPANKILAGIKKSNLRELAKKELEKRGTKCNCIRCSEPTNKLHTIKDYKIKKIKYSASKGTEYFIYAEDKHFLLGFIRLRIPYDPFVEELTKETGIVRELHVYGQSTNFSEHNIQHIGIGKKLLAMAEKIAKKHKMKEVAVISGVGVREYYKKQGYNLVGTYMIKKM